MKDERNQPESNLNREYGKGFNMLKKMGFKSGTGLGPTGGGITVPIEVAPRRPGIGLQDDEGEAQKKKADLKRRRLERKRASRPSGVDEDLDKDSSGSELEETEVVELSEEEKHLVQAKREVDDLLERKRELEFRAFSIKSLLDGISESSADSLNGLGYDLVESGLLSQSVHDTSLLSRVVNLLRDKYDSDALWYELECESVISAAISEMVNEVTEKVEVTPSLIEAVHELVVDDDHFARILEFQLLPAPALRPSRLLFQAIQRTASTLHYQSIFSRLLDEFFRSSLSDLRENTSWLVQDAWIDLVPKGSSYQRLVDDILLPRLLHSKSSEEISLYRKYLSEEEWKEVVYRKASETLESFRKISLSNTHAFSLVRTIVLEWAEILGPCVVGFLLVDSGFLPKWLELNKLEPDILKKECRIWFPLLAKVAYHSPAKKIVLEAIRIANGNLESRRRPGGPPPEFFSSKFNGVKQTITAPTAVDTGKVSLGDVIREEAGSRNVLVAPKPGVRENGNQVFKVGDKSVYWKDDSLFLKSAGVWTEVALDSIFS